MGLIRSFRKKGTDSKLELNFYNDGRHKKVSTIIFCIRINKEFKKVVIPRCRTNISHSKERILALVKHNPEGESLMALQRKTGKLYG